MSFEARDLVIDVLPLAQPGLVLCGQATAGDVDEEDADLECGQATADEPTAVSEKAEDDLARLRQQLRQTLASDPPL